MKFVIQKGNILGTAIHILSKLRKCSDPLIQDKLNNVEIPQQDYCRSSLRVRKILRGTAINVLNTFVPWILLLETLSFKNSGQDFPLNVFFENESE